MNPTRVSDATTAAPTWSPRSAAWIARAPSEFAGRPGRPLFIGACPRSGTTLLRSVLNNHPDLAVPAETDFLIPMWRRRAWLGDLREAGNRRKLAEWIFDTEGHGGRRIRAGAFSRDEAVERVVAAPPTLGSALAVVFGLFSEAKGKPRWGDKRPAYASYIDALFALFPDAQFINLVRDPRAAVESQLRTPWYRDWKKPPTPLAVAAWEIAVGRVDRFARRLRPDQLLDVRYENLVRDPQAELARICAFAGLRGGDAIAEMLGRPRGGTLHSDWHALVSEPISAARIDAWRERLEPHQVALIEQATGRCFERFGYVRVAPPGAAPSPDELRRLREKRVRRALKWRRYALGELKRRHLTYRHPVAAR